MTNEEGAIKSGFRITRGTGFQITLETGYTISVQFGAGDYCSNKMTKFAQEDQMIRTRQDIKSSNAEVAIMKDGKFVTGEILKGLFENEELGDVIGYVTPEQLLKILGKFIVAENLG
jgi:hypothetical protein